MKKILLSIAILSLFQAAVTACDKCGRSHHLVYAAPTYGMTTSAVAPMQTTYAAQVYAVPMTYAAPMTYSAPVTLQTTPASSLQFVPAQPSTVSAAPIYYTTAPTTQSAFSTPSFAAPASVYYTASAQPALSPVQAQGIVTDLLTGLAKPAACEVCRSIGCNSGSGGTTTDPLDNLRETIKGIGELIKAVKGLEKDVKDAVGSNTLDVEEPPVSAQSQIATLTQLRDEFRAMNQSDKVTRVAEGKP